jgi:hypothetical protein
VSSDPFADLARSLQKVHLAFWDLLRRDTHPAPGSPAVTEAEGEPYAGEWSQHPSMDVLGLALQAAVSAINHLGALGAVIEARSGPEPPYTVARATAEHAAAACYLTDPAIDRRERLRRGINRRLDGLCEQISLLGGLKHPQARAQAKLQADYTRGRIAAISRTAKEHGFPFHGMDGPGRPAYIGERPLSPMLLIDNCTPQEPGVGATYQRLLSAVAHAKPHGLARLLMPVPPSADPGERFTQINVTSDRLALELLAGPLCATKMLEQLFWFAGWDTREITGPVNLMLHTWDRVANIPSWPPQA